MSSAPDTFPCPVHPSTLTPAEARALALRLLTLADAAGPSPDPHVTRAQVVLELQSLRARAVQVERGLAMLIATEPPA